MEKIFFRSDAICETLRNGRLVRRGAGDFLLPQSMGVRSPHVLSRPLAVEPPRMRSEASRTTGTAHDRREFRRSSRT